MLFSHMELKIQHAAESIYQAGKNDTRIGIGRFYGFAVRIMQSFKAGLVRLIQAKIKNK